MAAGGEDDRDPIGQPQPHQAMQETAVAAFGRRANAALSAASTATTSTAPGSSVSAARSRAS